MLLVIPAMQGRDLNDVDVVVRGGEEWLRMGSTLRRPTDGVPTATKGASSLTIDDGVVASWLRFAAAGAVTTSGADAWKTFDAEMTPLDSGDADAGAI